MFLFREQHQVVAVDSFVAVGIAEAVFDLVGMAAGDVGQIVAVIGGEAAGQLVALSVDDDHCVAALEIAFDRRCPQAEAAPAATMLRPGAITMRPAGFRPASVRASAFDARLRAGECLRTRLRLG